MFTAPEGFDGNGCFWAPECHYHNGNFYLFATYLSRSSTRRGVSVFRSQSPLGPFEELSGGHVTPFDWDSIDGTLYIDGDGQPWMVFVHEWTSTADNTGTMAAAKMKRPDGFCEEPVELLRPTTPSILTGADGPFYTGQITAGHDALVKLQFPGILCRPIKKREITANGAGATPLYAKNGFLIRTEATPCCSPTDGRLLMLCIRRISGETVHETAVFLEVVDTGNSLEPSKSGEKVCSNGWPLPGFL